MNRRELLTGAAVLAGVTQANAFGIGKEGARFGHAGAVLGRAGLSTALSFYIAANGNDANPGTQSQPWLTMSKVTAQNPPAGSTVYFRGGDTFSGTLTLPASSGSVGLPITYTSYGTGNATIAPAASSDGVVGTDLSNITISNLNVTGSGGTDGHGVHLLVSAAACANWIVSGCTVTGMAGCGIWLYGGSAAGASLNNFQVLNCIANGNTTGWTGSSCGIRIGGGSGQQFSGGTWNATNGVISGCTANDNKGIAGTPSWCGTGIFVQRTKGFTVTNNIANRNGANCNNVAGPSGFLFGNCNFGTIRGNMAVNTATAGADGGGFDLDGGVDNCTMERNIAIANTGFGFMIYEYDDVNFNSNNNNIIRFNIALNDTAGSLRLTSGGTHDASGLVYGNTFYSVNASQIIKIEKNGGALTYTIANNNIHSGKAGTTDFILTSGNPSGALFYGNNYYTPNTPRITWNGTQYASVAAWRAVVTSQETITGADTSKSVVPINISSSINLPIRVYNGEPLRPDEASPLLNVGVDLFANFGINPGTGDFYGSALSTSGPWSIGHAAMKSALKSVILTGAGNQTIPADFAALYAVDCIGAGGGNTGGTTAAGGAAFARITSTTTPLVAGVTTIPYSAGVGVSAANGPDTWWNASSLANAVALGLTVACAAEGGKTNVTSTGGIGGKAANSVGSIKYDGGNGGNTANGFNGGGGGAGGLFGAGANGGNGGVASSGAGGGGGGNNGTVGLSPTVASTGGAGGGGPYNNAGPSGANNAGTAGTNGQGGSGASNGTPGSGGAGGNGSDWSTNGSGGGGGGGIGANPATNVGGLFGGGAGGRELAIGGNGGIRFLYKTSASL